MAAAPLAAAAHPPCKRVRSFALPLGANVYRRLHLTLDSLPDAAPPLLFCNATATAPQAAADQPFAVVLLMPCHSTVR